MATAYLSTAPFHHQGASPVHWTSSWGQPSAPGRQSPVAAPVSYTTPMYPQGYRSTFPASVPVAQPPPPQLLPPQPARRSLEEQVEAIDRLLTGGGVVRTEEEATVARRRLSRLTPQQMEDTLIRLQHVQPPTGETRRDIFDLLKALQSEILTAGEEETSLHSSSPSRSTSPTPGRAPKDQRAGTAESSALTEQSISRAQDWFTQGSSHREARRTADSRIAQGPTGLQAELAAFLREYPKYDAPKIDALRKREYSRLDKADPKTALPSIYLDYTGGSLYAEQAQLREFTALLKASVLGNPHSKNPTSEAADALVERAREAVAEYFHTEGQYEVIFTLNASNAIKMVGQNYPFKDGQVLLLADNHNSINGLREYAKQAGATVSYLPLAAPELRASEESLLRHLDAAPSDGHRLFAYPAQSNFSGVQHPLEWIEMAHRRGWDVLLDAAAFVPTNPLDVGHWKPDFVDVSFYKMFGLPTGVGALLVRKEKLPLLRRKAFFGGNVEYVGVGLQTHVMKQGHGGFEDGTLDYLNIPALELGLKHLRKVGINSIHDRVQALTGWLLSQLTALRHPSTGRPVVELYGPSGVHRRGGTVAVNFFTPHGRFVPHPALQELFAASGVSLRYGCFCNPGAFEAAVGMPEEGIEEAAACTDSAERGECVLRHAGVTGAVRISMGIASTFADVQRVVALVRQHLVDQPEASDL